MFTLFNTGRDRVRSVIVVDREIAQMDDTAMGAVASDVGFARYRLGGQRRAWLTQQNLADGVTGGDILRLPPLALGELEREIDIAPFDTSKWTSVRISDVGYCSIELSWGTTRLVAGTLGIPRGGFAGLLTRAVDDALSGATSLVGVRRITPALVQPVFRSVRSGGRLTPHDTVRFAADYFATQLIARPIGLPFTCNDVTIQVDFEFRLERGRQAAISYAPQCLEPLGSGGTLNVDADPAFDHNAVIESVTVDISDACVYKGDAEGMAEDLVRALLPGVFTDVIRDAGLIDPRDAGFAESDVRSCTCDGDCNQFSPLGPAFDPSVVPRPRCHYDPNAPQLPGAGECWVQFEFDRVEFTPQGLEVVISEDETDVQQDLVEELIAGVGVPGVRDLVCGPDREWLTADIDVTDPSNGMAVTLGFPVMSP